MKFRLKKRGSTVVCGSIDAREIIAAPTMANTTRQMQIDRLTAEYAKCNHKRRETPPESATRRAADFQCETILKRLAIFNETTESSTRKD